MSFQHLYPVNDEKFTEECAEPNLPSSNTCAIMELNKLSKLLKRLTCSLCMSMVCALYI
jgi:hypothetical protein